MKALTDLLSHLNARALTCIAAGALSAALHVAQAAVLTEQPPDLLTPDAVVNGTEFQASRMAEGFSFQGSAHTLTWWGTAGGQFTVELYATADLATPLVSVAGPVPGVAVGSLEVDGADATVYAFTVALGTLAGGDYTVSIRETALDAQLETWYWLRSTQGDGQSIRGLGEGSSSFSDHYSDINDFDLALRVDGDAMAAAELGAPPTLLLAALASALAGLGRCRGRGMSRIAAERQGHGGGGTMD